MDKLEVYRKLLHQNKQWVERKNKEDRLFFEKLADTQRPEFFWIGCSDSRVPANQITDTGPGEIFVHRNIANMVIHTDMSLLSTLDFAVNVLQVKHIIVCGHYGCSGIRAAMQNQQMGIMDNWIRHIKDIYSIYKDELNAIENMELRERTFTEFNVKEQVFDLSETSIIQSSWKKQSGPWIHGWVYDVRNGIIKDLDVSMNGETERSSTR